MFSNKRERCCALGRSEKTWLRLSGLIRRACGTDELTGSQRIRRSWTAVVGPLQLWMPGLKRFKTKKQWLLHTNASPWPMWWILLEAFKTFLVLRILGFGRSLWHWRFVRTWAWIWGVPKRCLGWLMKVGSSWQTIWQMEVENSGCRKLGKGILQGWSAWWNGRF